MAVSLARVDPAALVSLRRTGTCTFDVPEAVFDLVYPGQYRRHLRSVGVTIPCVAGPFSPVSAELTLLASHVRDRPVADARVPVHGVRTTAITTSSAQNDAGVFELSFRDDRRLPFEGAGVDSRWQIRLPARMRSFDYETITDVVLHFAYDARGDDGLRRSIESDTGALEAFLTRDSDPPPLALLFSLRAMAPDAFRRLLRPGAGAVEVTIDRQWLPYVVGFRNVVLRQAILAVHAPVAPAGSVSAVVGAESFALGRSADRLASTLSADVTSALAAGLLGTVSLGLTASAADLTRVEDLWLYVALRLEAGAN